MKITKQLAVRTGVAMATVAMGAGIFAQSADAAGLSTSYAAHVKVASNSSVTFKGTCQAGTHVRGSRRELNNSHILGRFIPTVKVSNGWIYNGDAIPTTPVTDGKDYRFTGFEIHLHNCNIFTNEVSTVSWICDPN